MEKTNAPFTLPNGKTVLLKQLTITEYDAINKWVKKKYMENVREACMGLDEQTKLELRLAALDKAATLSFQTTEGREILFGDIEGFAYMAYQTIESPAISFKDFYSILYPDGILTETGIKCIIEMMSAAYEGDADAEELKKELSPGGELYNEIVTPQKTEETTEG